MNVKTEQLYWRRNKILELSSQGHTERDIANTLQVALGTVHRDINIMKNLAKANISKYINETLPFEYQKCMIGLDAILVRTWSMANNDASMERDKLQALSIAMQAYNMKLDLLSNATVIERAINFVEKHRGLVREKHRGLVRENINPLIDTEHNDITESKQDTG